MSFELMADSSQVVVQIKPLRVHFFDQAEAFFFRAALDLPLALFSCRGILHCLVIDQLDQVVAAGGHPTVAGAMLGNPVFQIAGTPGVKQAVLLVGHDVDAELGVVHMSEADMRLLYIYLDERGNRSKL